jgi:hypothetical protein
MTSEVDDLLLSEMLSNLPSGVKLEGVLQFNMDEIIQDALKEGYYIVLFLGDRIDNIRLDGEYVKYHSINNEANQLRTRDTANWPDKVCCVWPKESRVHFLSRKYYKGNPSQEWGLHREDDKPAVYTPYEVCWLRNGAYHRDGNKPAAVSLDAIDWCVNGKWHRDDGGPTKINTTRQEITHHLNHKVILFRDFGRKNRF